MPCDCDGIVFFMILEIELLINDNKHQGMTMLDSCSSRIHSSFDLSGRHEVEVGPEGLWKSLNDPAALQACIGRCSRVEMQAPGSFVFEFVLQLGPTRRKLLVDVRVVDIDPPDRYRLIAQLQGQGANTAKGTADVFLGSLPGGCSSLSYAARIEVSGWLALVGERVLAHAARRSMKRFLADLEQWRQIG